MGCFAVGVCRILSILPVFSVKNLGEMVKISFFSGLWDKDQL